MRRGRAILVVWAAVAVPAMAALASCVQDLPAGSPPEVDAGSDGTTQDAPVPPEDRSGLEGSPDALAEATSDVSDEVTDAESTDADAESTDADAESADADAQADVVDGGGPADAGDGGDASSASDANDASSATDASDAGGSNDASDAGGSSDASDAGGANDASDAASDASVTPCAFVMAGTECQQAGSCTMDLPVGSIAGDLLVVVFAVGANATPSVPSGWSLATFQDNSASGCNVGIWYYPNAPGGITSVTFSVGGSDSVRGILSEWRYATQLDEAAALTGTSSTTMSVSTPAITASGECAISAFGQKLSSAQAVSFTAGSGWTGFPNNASSSTNYHLASDYRLSPAVAAVSETETSNTTGDWVGAIATFK